MKTVYLSLLTILLFFGALIAEAASVSNVRLWPAPDRTRLVLDLDEAVRHKVFTLESPHRLVIDIEDVKSRASFSTLDYSDTPVKRIRTGIRNKNDLRVVLDLAAPVKPKSFVLKPNDQYGHRLVVDLEEPHAGRKRPPKTTASTADLKRDIVVVIDAGHGGDDPGAIGPGRLREKAVVLSIARNLQAMLKRQRGFSPRMTRKGDYYIGLRERTRLARQYNADLFVSIHADAFKSPAARGASVYALSHRGATSETARWLANEENRSDLIGGVGGVSLGDKDDVLAGVLLDLSMTASLKASLSVGDHVVSSMGSIAHLHKKQVEQAAFVVLKSPDIPSILVETGFISNPGEASRLRTTSYQRRMASAIFKGVLRYFEKTPPPGTYVAWAKNHDRSGRHKSYTIESGDTLSGIASKNRVSLSQLKEINGLDGDKVLVGQVIRIPAS